ncbi:MAG: hypothetical protein NVSMB47_21520 [Polyangiales bacterium]
MRGDAERPWAVMLAWEAMPERSDVPPTTEPNGEASAPQQTTLQSAPAYRPATPVPQSIPTGGRVPPSFTTLRGEILEHGPHRIRARCPVDAAWLNPYGVLQGGFLTAMIDNLVGMCALAHDPARQSATIELSVRFFRSIRAGHVIIDGTTLRAGRTTVTVECVAWDETGELCAKATATNMVLG